MTNVPPSILVVGATGNTGKNCVKTLSDHIKNSSSLSNHQIIALTRSRSSSIAKTLYELPNVIVEEYNWPEITSEWLQKRKVTRAFIAAYNGSTQFSEESGFYVAALHANVEYVVRISTTAANVFPDSKVFYARTHWAIESMLSSAEFSKLQWTSLQPNIFDTMILAPAIEYINQFKKGQNPETLKLLLDENTPSGIISPDDVGRLAAILLTQNDTSKYNQKKLVLNGPKDVLGKEIVHLVEKQTGQKVKNVIYKDTSFVDTIISNSSPDVKHLLITIKLAPITTWEGLSSTSTTSQEVFKLAPSKIPLLDTFNALLG